MTYVRTHRLDANQVRLHSDLDTILFANVDVPIDRASLREASALAEIVTTIQQLNQRRFFGDYEAAVERAVLTPDFHKGAGIPVGTVLATDGFVLPRCVGSDVGCGMRLIVTDLVQAEFDRCANLDTIFRHAFFEGGRDVPLDEASRAGMLREGIIGMHPPHHGLWRYVDRAQMIADLDRTHRLGSWPTTDLWMFADYVRGSGGISRDAAIGTIGGGNHFCELQVVDECLDRATCNAWGIRSGAVTIMVHTGSTSLGGMIGDHFVQQAKRVYPTALKAPAHGYQPLPTIGPLAAEGGAYLGAMGLGANFATANRLVLGEMALRCLSQAAGRLVSGRLVYDAPHNLIWTDDQRHLHRKGATPAGCDHHDPAFPNGHPVIIPGSMGDASYVLRGCGNVASLCSAPHGAGRAVARGVGRHSSPEQLDKLRIVTKIDLAKARRDVAEQYRKDLLEESPAQYKPIRPVIDTVVNANIASTVACLRPLLTVKG